MLPCMFPSVSPALLNFNTELQEFGTDIFSPFVQLEKWVSQVL